MRKASAGDIFEPEKPIVPAGWDVIPFEEAAQVVSDRGRRVKQGAYLPAGKIPVIDQGQEYIGGYTDSDTMAFKGELPVVLFGDHTRAIKYVERNFAVGAEGIKILKPADCYQPKFFYYLLRSLQIPSRGYSRHFQFLRKFHFPVAPQPQQKRIVAEIEKQFSRLDEAVANLKRVKANLKRYKAAVLKAAVEGNLTEEWRKAHLPAPTSRPGKFYTYAILCDDDSIYIGHTDDIERRWKEHRDGKGSDWTKEHKPVKIAHYEEYDTREEAAEREKWLKTGYGRKWIKRELAAGRTRQAGDVEPASELLKRILAERRAKWKGKGKYKERATPGTTDLLPLPKTWAWATVGQVAEVLLGKMLDKQKHRTGQRLPYLRNINVRWGSIDTDGVLDMFFKEEELERYGLRTGDVLVCEGGEPGRAAVWEGKKDAMKYQKALHRVRFYGEYHPRLLVFNLEYLSKTGRLERWFTGTTIKHFTRESFIELPIPIPPPSEQERIVAEADRRLSVIENLEGASSANLQRADRLRQSILWRAFTGQLTSQMALETGIPSQTFAGM